MATFLSYTRRVLRAKGGAQGCEAYEVDDDDVFYL
jgi:hypothetical protein